MARTSNITTTQKKDWAKLLFIKDNKTQKEIAQIVSVTEKTLSKWVNDNKWEALRSSFVITKEQELRRLYIQINELNNFINEKEEGKRFATNQEADILSKLAAAAKNLESETSVADIINVFMDFLDWLQKVDFAKSQEIAEVQDNYIKYKLSKF